MCLRWERHRLRGVSLWGGAFLRWNVRPDGRHSNVIQQRLSEHVGRAGRQSHAAQSEWHPGVLLYLPRCVLRSCSCSMFWLITVFKYPGIERLHNAAFVSLTSLHTQFLPSHSLPSDCVNTGYVSWRDTESGSWYVETLNQILEDNADTDDLVTMLMMVSKSSRDSLCRHVDLFNPNIPITGSDYFQVNNEVSRNSAKGIYKQMPGSFNFLRKLLHFQSPASPQTPP